MASTPTSAAARTSLPEKAVLTAVAAAGLVSALLFLLARGSFWEDEIIAFTHGLQPLSTFFSEVLRNDIHPPVYFLLLKAWTSVTPDTDTWVLASSLLSALFSAAVIARVTCLRFGARAAWWAFALFVALPNFAWASGNLRMYALLPGLAVLMWHANARFLESGRKPWLAAAFLLEAALIYLHIIEFFFVAFIALGAWAVIRERHPGNTLRHWLLMQTGAAFLTLPILASALLRGSEPLPIPGLHGLVAMPAQLITGWKLAGNESAMAAGGAIFFGLLVFALANRAARASTLVTVCGALLASMLVALGGKPIFKPPVFTANLVPFLVIGGAAGIAGLASARARALALVPLAALGFATFSWSAHLLPRESYRPAAEHVAGQARPGDVVLVPNVSVYWGIVRYAVGPRWGHPLDVMPMTDNPAWAGLKKKLGPGLAERLGLNPARDTIQHGGIRYVIGNTLSQGVAPGHSIFLVMRKNYRETAHLPQSVRPADVAWFNDELSVSLLVPADVGIFEVVNPPAPDTGEETGEKE